MGDIGNLIIKIGANATELERAFTQLGGSAAQFQKGLATLGAVASTAFFAAAAGATALAIAAGKQAEELEQLASITGINTDKLQEYDVMLNRAGLTGQDLAQVMKQISTNLDQARQGIGTAGDRFRQLGIDIRNVTGTDDLIQKLAQSQARFADGVGKSAVMSDLLGKGWQTFMRAFAGGKKAFDDVADASKNLGLTLSGSNLAVLARMDTAVDDLMTAFKRFGQQLAVAIAPSIEFVTKILTQFLAFGSKAFHEMNLLLDVFAVKITHMALKAGEVFGTLFSSNIFSAEAWKQTLANIDFIDQASDQQIAKLRAAHALTRDLVAPDQRPALPMMVDSAKEAQRLGELAELRFRTQQAASQQMDTLARAQLANRMAYIEQEKAFGIKSDQEAAFARMSQLDQMSLFTEESLQRQLVALKAFASERIKLFGTDAKAVQDRAKFEEDIYRQRIALEKQLEVAALDADTMRVQSGLQVKTFWQKQLDDIVASNAFSISQITTTWTGGLANSLVNGGKFVEQAWKATQVAVIQGGLQMGIQWAAQQGAMVLASATSAASIAALDAAKNSAIIAGNTVTASITTSVWGGAALAISGFFASVLAGFEAMVATMVATVTAVGAFIMGVLSAIAEALTATVFGIPWAGAIVVGIALIAAALAATGNLGFAKGGIGDFGAGTPAMLHGTEMIVPLDQRGADFVQRAFGNGGDRPIHTHVILNGREIAKAVSDDQFSSLRSMGVL